MSGRKITRVAFWMTLQVLVLAACLATVYAVAYFETTIGEAGIAFAILTVGIIIASFFVWLAVRILNRREKRAIWTAVVLPLPLYVLSILPARWLHVHKVLPPWADRLLDVCYLPVLLFLPYILPIAFLVVLLGSIVYALSLTDGGQSKASPEVTRK